MIISDKEVNNIFNFVINEMKYVPDIPNNINIENYVKVMIIKMFQKEKGVILLPKAKNV